MYSYNNYIYRNELYHHGIPGMKWGVRRFQNEDGTLTEAGKKRYAKEEKRLEKGKRGSLDPKSWGSADKAGTIGGGVLAGAIAGKTSIGMIAPMASIGKEFATYVLANGLTAGQGATILAGTGALAGLGMVAPVVAASAAIGYKVCRDVYKIADPSRTKRK